MDWYHEGQMSKLRDERVKKASDRFKKSIDEVGHAHYDKANLEFWLGYYDLSKNDKLKGLINAK